jgi:hypothetical protein
MSPGDQFISVLINSFGSVLTFIFNQLFANTIVPLITALFDAALGTAA